MNRQYIGFDPGKSGHGIKLEGSEVTKYKYPLIGDEYDIEGMIEIFKNFDRDRCHIVIEDVKALQTI